MSALSTPVYVLPLSIEDRSVQAGALRATAAALYAGQDPARLPTPAAIVEVERDTEDPDNWKWRIPVAFAHQGDVTLSDADGDLVIEGMTPDFGRVRRVRRVPALLLRCSLKTAQLRLADTSGAYLELTYHMHTAHWPQS